MFRMVCINSNSALMFIDKYSQVYRILNPIVTCIDLLGPICERDQGIKEYIEKTFGGVQEAIRTILVDFFRYAFDGRFLLISNLHSGADNFFDAGSCIDGRLTSAWNWCSKLEKKEYFFVFLLTGFVGFDGQF